VHVHFSSILCMVSGSYVVMFSTFGPVFEILHESLLFFEVQTSLTQIHKIQRDEFPLHKISQSLLLKEVFTVF